MHEVLDHGITCIETGYFRPGLAACYLLVDTGEAAVIETGTSHSVPRILRVLAQQGLAPEAVRWIIPTHVHLDHAGGAGALLRHCPNAGLVVHPRGARHLIDPSRLIAGAREVYGAERLETLYGEIVPAPAARVREAPDGSEWPLGSRRLLVRDTPGHARHHFCVWDPGSRGWFTGDTFGIGYRELHTAAGPFLFPTTTPVQFEPVRLLESIALLMQADPAFMYLTHFGRIAPRIAEASALREQVMDYVRLAMDCAGGEDAEARLCAALGDYTLARLRAAGCDLDEAELRELLRLDMELNASGLMIWKRQQAA